MIAAELLKTGCKIGYPVAAVYAFNFGTKHVGVFDVILVAIKLWFRRAYRKFAAFLPVEKAAEYKAGIEARQAHPGYVGVSSNQGQVGAIANYAVVIGMFIHGHPVWLNSAGTRKIYLCRAKMRSYCYLSTLNHGIELLYNPKYIAECNYSWINTNQENKKPERNEYMKSGGWGQKRIGPVGKNRIRKIF